MRHHEKESDEAKGLESLLPAWTDLSERVAQVRDAMRSLNSVHTTGATPRVIVNGASQSVSRNPGKLLGFTLRETVGGVAVVRLHDGADASGDLLYPVGLTNNESRGEWFGPQGIAFTNGVYVEVVSGSIEGVVFLI